MAQILPQNPGSTEIQSPLIAGITEGLNKISATLSLKIGDLSDVSLSAVPVDSSEKNKNRIYEAETGNRLWLSDPAPVIKKNGEVIEQTTSNFTIDYVGGSITFPEDSKPSDSDKLTVTCKYIIGTSETISQIQDQLSQTSEKASKYKGYFETEGDLKLEHPTASDGDFALVMSPLTIYAWTSGGWKDTRADANLDAHLADFNNPHRVDVEQIGAETPEGAQQKADAAKAAAISASDPKGSAAAISDGVTSGSIKAANATSADSASVASRLSDKRTISISGGATGTATGFDGTENISIPVTGLDMSKATAGTLPVERGGTGKNNLDNVKVGLAASLSSPDGTKRFNINDNGDGTWPRVLYVAGSFQLTNFESFCDIGRYLDFHNQPISGIDYDVRIGANLSPNYYLYIQNKNLPTQEGAIVCSPSGNVLSIPVMTQSAYNALENKDEKTMYIIVG